MNTRGVVWIADPMLLVLSIISLEPTIPVTSLQHGEE
jgi:hypothetical protein